MGSGYMSPELTDGGGYGGGGDGIGGNGVGAVKLHTHR